MSSFGIKLIAVVTMLIDHVGFVFFPAVIIFRIIGRISFPLFAFLLAEGFSKTRNAGWYVGRLATFSVLSQIPYMMVFQGFSGWNIFFTLSLGLLLLIVSRRISSKVVFAMVTLLTVLFAEAFGFEYGAYGILLILACSVLLQKRKVGLAVVVTLVVVAGILKMSVSGAFDIQIFALAAVPFMLFYNGERGKVVSKWWFYVFYPAHLVVLALLRFLI